MQRYRVPYPQFVVSPYGYPYQHVGPYPAVAQYPGVSVQPAEGLALAVNRYIAGRLGMDPRYTISTNVALAISRATGIAYPMAKGLFHAGVAGFVGWVLHAFGIGVAATFGLGALLWGWLESFDSSSARR